MKRERGEKKGRKKRTVPRKKRPTLISQRRVCSLNIED
jgi:hypothetical protein